VSRVHEGNPYVFHADGREYRVDYIPGESSTWLFGGNSNWRGPIWFPINYLLLEAFGRYHRFYGDTLRVECPTGSGRWMNLEEVARDLASGAAVPPRRVGPSSRPRRRSALCGGPALESTRSLPRIFPCR